MERLTKYNDFAKCYLPFSLIGWDFDDGKIMNRLGELEDVLEKWHIEDLDKFIEEQITEKRELNNILWGMEQDLAELKQNAIIPKYQIGQKVFIILDGTVKETNIDSITIFAGNELSYYCKYVNDKRIYLELAEDEIFTTKEEAEQKLAETKGEKDE